MIPTLEPSRDGFTQTGSPSASRRSRQPSSPTWQKSTWAIPRSRSSRLKMSLSMRHRRGQHVGADVGDVEALEQALDAAVLAERAVQDREGDVAAEQARRGAEVDLGAPSWIQRPSRSIDHVERLVAGVAQALGDGGAGAQRDLVLAGAAAADHGDPHGELVVVVELVVRRSAAP